ncbi:DUF29 domain-containing protein [Methylobacterium gregans]|uniref:DUF29 domain-containing protein n=1 Tax=Methylobacterium gregans TaxID=374424 RepID=A0AA37HT28_9HYPH|nr:DUF29 domain-containing protein [Methylobacterium gregans]MDQ0522610.1 hypothetical protein [Methylobacterium gregans]GJD81398.1 hypothetical protein NBEOAGPD_4645 [Methylobacterium gregans]
MAPPAPTREDAPSAPGAAGRTRYADDLYTWVQEQVALLRAGRVDALDLDNIAEELSDVGASEYYRLQSAIEVVLLHMLKWDQQPERRTRSWVLSIAEHRDRAQIQLRKSPGLKSSLDEVRADGFRLARLRAAREMRRALKTLPAECPYGWDDILNRPFEYEADR